MTPFAHTGEGPWRGALKSRSTSTQGRHMQRGSVFASSVRGMGPTAQFMGVAVGIGSLSTHIIRAPMGNILVCYQQLTPPKNFLCS